MTDRFGVLRPGQNGAGPERTGFGTNPGLGSAPLFVAHVRPIEAPTTGRRTVVVVVGARAPGAAGTPLGRLEVLSGRPGGRPRVVTVQDVVVGTRPPVRLVGPPLLEIVEPLLSQSALFFTGKIVFVSPGGHGLLAELPSRYTEAGRVDVDTPVPGPCRRVGPRDIHAPTAPGTGFVGDGKVAHPEVVIFSVSPRDAGICVGG